MAHEPNTQRSASTRHRVTRHAWEKSNNRGTATKERQPISSKVWKPQGRAVFTRPTITVNDAVAATMSRGPRMPPV